MQYKNAFSFYELQSDLFRYNSDYFIKYSTDSLTRCNINIVK